MSDGSLFDLSAYGSDEPVLETDSEPIEPEIDEKIQPAPSLGMRHFDETPSVKPVAAIRQEAAAAPTALYRKYRPQTFAANEHFGQEHIVNTLRNAIALDRIAHAYLFCGPRGTGKTSTARILAKAVNCEDPDPYNRPCNVCPSCIAISTGATTDVIEIDAASNRGIDDIRDLRERVKYAPTQLKTKFYIIDEAHQITGAAANAFLKTLEEPPAHTKFVLATTDPEDLLQTIVSRCQRFDFRRISLEAMVANLTKIAEAEHIDIDDEAKIMIARHATGSLRDAQGLLDQVAVYRENADDTNTTVTANLVRTVLGVSRNDRVADIVSAFAERDAGIGVRAIGEAVAAGDDVRQLARQLLTFMRELLLERSGGQSDLDNEGKALAQRFELAELAELTRMMGDIDFKVKHATISQLPLEIAVIEGAIRGSLPASRSQPPIAATPAPTPNAASEQQVPPLKPAGSGGLIGRVQGSARRPQPTDSTPQRPSESAPTLTPAPDAGRSPKAQTPASGDSDVDQIRTRWGHIRADVHAVSVRVGALLSETDPVGLEGDKVLLTVPYPFHATKINSDEARPIVEQVMSRVMGRQLTVECFTIEDFRNRASRSTTAKSAVAPIAAESKPVVEPVTENLAATTPPAKPEIDPTESLRAVRNIFDAEEISPENS